MVSLNYKITSSWKISHFLIILFCTTQKIVKLLHGSPSIFHPRLLKNKLQQLKLYQMSYSKILNFPWHFTRERLCRNQRTRRNYYEWGACKHQKMIKRSNFFHRLFHRSYSVFWCVCPVLEGWVRRPHTKYPFFPADQRSVLDCVCPLRCLFSMNILQNFWIFLKGWDCALRLAIFILFPNWFRSFSTERDRRINNLCNIYFCSPTCHFKIHFLKSWWSGGRL